MTWIPYITMFLLALVGVFLIFIILLQRGRGGGLAGALGGMGGTSAFGTRAGDVFTWITIYLAIAWAVLAAGNVYALRITTDKYDPGTAEVPSAPAIEATGGAGDTPGEEGVPESTKPAGEPLKVEPESFPGDAAKPAEKPASEEQPANDGKPGESTEKTEKTEP